MAVRLRTYTNNLRVNKEIAAIPTLPEAQVLCTQKFTKEKSPLKINLSNSRLKKNTQVNI